MAASLKERQVAWLTANCDCWKGQAETLNEMTDEQLAKLAANANKQVKLELTLNAAQEVLDEQGYKLKETATANGPMPAFIKEKMHGGKKAVEEEEEEEAKTCPECGEEMTDNTCDCGYSANQAAPPPRRPKRTNNEEKHVKTTKPRNAAEWLAANNAPDEIQDAVANAMEIQKVEKVRLVSKLVANLKGEARKEAIAYYGSMKIPALKAELKFRPTAPSANQGSGQRGFLGQEIPDYLLQGAAPVTNEEPEGGDEDDDPLGIMTMNELDEQLAKKQKRA